MSLFEYMKGTVVDKEIERLVLDVHGIGYLFNTHPGFNDRLPRIGEEGIIYTHLQVREDNMQLYGFPGLEEKALFLQLIQVSGIGPKVAMAITGTLEPSQFALAVMNDDVARLTQVKGIGKKSAERLLVEMRDKVKKTMTLPAQSVAQTASPHGAIAESLEALIVLGYRQDEAAAALATLDPALETEAMIRQALQSMGQKRGLK